MTTIAKYLAPVGDRNPYLTLIIHKRNRVIPAKAGIQMISKFPRKWGNIMALSASRQIFLLLDTGLHPPGVRRGCKGLKPRQHTQRRYDGLMDHLGLTSSQQFARDDHKTIAPVLANTISQIATKNDRGRRPAILSGKIDRITATPTPATIQQLIE